jgi:Spy/CpxP family protein refolding chaperone
VVNPRAKGAALLVAVFALGGLAGGGGTYAWLRRDDAVGGEDDRAARSPRRLRALERSLDLTADQSARVRAIMGQSGDQRRQLAQEMYDRCGDGLRAHHDAVSAQIRALLTPEQQARFDVIASQQRERFPFGGPTRGGDGRRRGPRGDRGL